MTNIHNCGLTKNLAEVLESSKYSDTTVRCGSEEFKLHRNIVCPRSEFFAAACDGQFKETKTSTIVLEEDDPPTVRRMFTYLYTLAYDDKGDAAPAQHYMVNGTKGVTSQALTTTTTPLTAEEVSRHARMMNNVVVYAVAHKYDIGDLQELAATKFRELLWLGAPSHCPPDVIDAVFETTAVTDPGLRDVAAEFCTHYSTEIVADDRLCTIIKDHGELGLNVLCGVNKYAVETCQQKNALQKKLVTVKGELAQMINDASTIKINGPYWDFSNAEGSISRLLQKLQAAHNNVGS